MWLGRHGDIRDGSGQKPLRPMPDDKSSQLWWAEDTNGETSTQVAGHSTHMNKWPWNSAVFVVVAFESTCVMPVTSACCALAMRPKCVTVDSPGVMILLGNYGCLFGSKALNVMELGPLSLWRDSIIVVICTPPLRDGRYVAEKCVFDLCATTRQQQQQKSNQYPPAPDAGGRVGRTRQKRNLRISAKTCGYICTQLDHLPTHVIQ